MAWLYIQYQSLLYSEIIRIVQSSTDAEDVLHTVIEKLIDKVGFLRKLDRRGLVNYIVKAEPFCPEIAGLFCHIAGLFCHSSRTNLSLKPACFDIAIS